MDRDSGLTLIEVVVVIALVALLSGVLYRTFDGLLKSKTLTLQDKEADQLAQFFLSKLALEIASAQVIPLNVPDKQQGKTQPPVFIETTNAKNFSRDADSLRFVTANSSLAVNSTTANFGRIEVHYYLKEREQDELRRFELIREESPARVANLETIKRRAFAAAILENVYSLNFRYYFNSKWRSEWTEGSALPEIIEISLELQNSDGSKRSYRTALAYGGRSEDLEDYEDSEDGSDGPDEGENTEP